MTKSLLLVLIVWSWTGLSTQAQPKPGDIFREHRYTAETIFELDPGSKRTDAKLLKRRSISHRERTLDIYDLKMLSGRSWPLNFGAGMSELPDKSSV